MHKMSGMTDHGLTVRPRPNWEIVPINLSSCYSRVRIIPLQVCRCPNVAFGGFNQGL